MRGPRTWSPPTPRPSRPARRGTRPRGSLPGAFPCNRLAGIGPHGARALAEEPAEEPAVASDPGIGGVRRSRERDGENREGCAAGKETQERRYCAPGRVDLPPVAHEVPGSHPPLRRHRGEELSGVGRPEGDRPEPPGRIPGEDAVRCPAAEAAVLVKKEQGVLGAHTDEATRRGLVAGEKRSDGSGRLRGVRGAIPEHEDP